VSTGPNTLLLRESTVDVQPDQSEASNALKHGWPQSQSEAAVVVDAYADRLVRYAFRQLGNLQDAEDVVQDVFVRVFAERSHRAKVLAVGPYLYRSVANACTDLLRRRNCGAVFREEVGAREMLTGADDPSVIAEVDESLRRAEAMLSRLPKEQAQVIRLRVFDELRLNEIADALGCPVNTVCSRLRYGFQKLRGLMAGRSE
jgi:RNA polymerase sigma-70 factor (ECF subfamily)